ncbi:MAG: SDR family NAD(P)-dependent oxidoreductase [Clostridia bacterium]|nr:SDR family NAD(P)-dependent oxidoreductase [Clostridia bacterium]
MKKIAVITGASSGIGKEFALKIKDFGKFDELWVIARNKEKLEELSSTISVPIKAIPLDLTVKEDIDKYQQILSEEKPEVSLLINCSGFGKFAKTTDYPLEENLNMVDLNCKAVISMCLITVPFMKNGSNIINIASIAAFQPIPYINVYAATKAFVLYFSRGLNQELKDKGIHVMAVCPFWTKTAFFDRAVSNGEPVVKKYIAMYEPKDIVKRALRDLKRKKDVSKYGFKARGQAFLCKILPHSLVMKVWKKQQRLK